MVTVCLVFIMYSNHQPNTQGVYPPKGSNSGCFRKCVTLSSNLKAPQGDATVPVALCKHLCCNRFSFALKHQLGDDLESTFHSCTMLVIVESNLAIYIKTALSKDQKQPNFHWNLNKPFLWIIILYIGKKA